MFLVYYIVGGSTQMKDKILILRNKGLSYREIQEKLNCSKATISYHCGKNQKHKKNNRQQKRRTTNCLISKIDNFRHRKSTNIVVESDTRDWRFILQIKIRGFSMNRKLKRTKQKFSLQDLVDKIGDNPTCYLTGRPIDLSDGRSYHLDHIVPISKGGDNSLNNCNIACKEANQAKHNLSKDEFIKLCQDVINKSQA